MTIDEIAIIIAESQKRVNDLSYIEILKAQIKAWRNTIIRQTLQSNPAEEMYFVMDCNYELEPYTPFESRYDKGETILRTKDQIINPLRIGEFSYVGSPTMQDPFGKVESGSIALMLNSKKTKDAVFYRFSADRRIYIYNATDLPLIGTTYIPESPEDLIAYRDKVDVKSVKYQITDDVANKIIRAINSEARQSEFNKVNNPEQVSINNAV